MLVGRPTKYDEAYPNLLLKHMEEGLSYQSFAATLGVHVDTLYEWEKVYPEFSEAKKIGKGLLLLFFEKLGRAASAGRVENFNATAFVWLSKNMIGWRDKVAITDEDGGPFKSEMSLDILKNPKTLDALKVIAEAVA